MLTCVGCGDDAFLESTPIFRFPMPSPHSEICPVVQQDKETFSDTFRGFSGGRGLYDKISAVKGKHRRGTNWPGRVSRLREQFRIIHCSPSLPAPHIVVSTPVSPQKRDRCFPIPRKFRYYFRFHFQVVPQRPSEKEPYRPIKPQKVFLVSPVSHPVR